MKTLYDYSIPFALLLILPRDRVIVFDFLSKFPYEIEEKRRSSYSLMHINPIVIYIYVSVRIR